MTESNALFRRSELEKADLLGERLVGGATEVATTVIEETGRRYKVGFRDGNDAQQFVIEVIVFYMHLVDVLAFGILGPERRKIFGDRLIIAVVRELLQLLSRDICADDFGEALRGTYNRRQIEYSRYRVLIPEKDRPLKNTLYWEFSKILFGMLDAANPAMLMFLNVLVADLTDVMLNEALKAGQVLRS